MSDKLRARARELAEEIANPFLMTKALITVDAIEAAILTGMCEALREEPDEGMLMKGTDAARCTGRTAHDCFNAMAEARARGLE